jgi:RNA polymerase sigma-70 factor (ECF subfamily)
MPEPELDEITLRLASRGDRAACKRLVERYQALVFSVVARVLGTSSHDVPDAAQEAFLRAFGALGEFDPKGPSKLSTWLATIATRVALDLVRKRRPVVPLDAARDARDHAVRDPGEVLDEGRRRARLAAAMERLAPEQRAAVVLRVEHELSYEETARALGVEVGTVKSRLARARQALLAAVGEHEDEDAVRDGHG